MSRPRQGKPVQSRTPRKRLNRTSPAVPQPVAQGSPRPTRPADLHLLCDATGNLPNHMLSVFLTQFPQGSMQVKLHNFLNRKEALKAALDELGPGEGVVLHAFVSDESKAMVEAACRKKRIPCCDLTGKFVDFIAQSTGIAAMPNVEILHEVSDEYRDRIRAIEYTLAHDDGLGLDTLHRADVVLTGISRTSKTPTSFVLGQQGYRVGNVALAIEVPPPRELLAMPREKVIGLVIDPIRLLDVRRSRGREWKMRDADYMDMDHIQREVRWSRKLFQQQGWKTLDVTDSAIEETAARVISLARLPATTW